MNKYIITAAAIASLITTPVNAKELLGFQFGYTYWDGGIVGNVRGDAFPASDGSGMLTGSYFSAAEFGVSEDTFTAYSIGLNHDFPGIPKIKYSRNPIVSEGTSQLTLRDLNFAGNQFTTGANMQSKYDLSYDDLTLYYNVADKWYKLDLGLTQRNLSGELELRTDDVAVDDGADPDAPVTDTGPTISTAKIKKNPLLLYADLSIDLPNSPFSVANTWQYGKSNTDNFNDVEYTVAYSTEHRNYTFRLEAGYKRTHFFSDDLGDLGSILKVRGPFLRLVFGI